MAPKSDTKLLAPRGTARGTLRIGRWRLRRPRRLIAALVLFVMLSTAAGFVYRQVRIFSLEAEIRRAQAEIQAVEMRNQELRRQIEFLHSREYVEQVAREKLGLVMPGEIVYDIAEPKEIPEPFNIPRRNPKPKAGY